VNVGAAGTIAISACAFGTTLQILVNAYRKVSTRSNFSGYATTQELGRGVASAFPPPMSFSFAIAC
jgi:hypothetical protein